MGEKEFYADGMDMGDIHFNCGANEFYSTEVCVCVCFKLSGLMIFAGSQAPSRIY